MSWFVAMRTLFMITILLLCFIEPANCLTCQPAREWIWVHAWENFTHSKKSLITWWSQMVSVDYYILFLRESLILYWWWLFGDCPFYISQLENKVGWSKVILVLNPRNQMFLSQIVSWLVEAMQRLVSMVCILDDQKA